MLYRSIAFRGIKSCMSSFFEHIRFSTNYEGDIFLNSSVRKDHILLKQVVLQRYQILQSQHFWKEQILYKSVSDFTKVEFYRGIRYQRQRILKIVDFVQVSKMWCLQTRWGEFVPVTFLDLSMDHSSLYVITSPFWWVIKGVGIARLKLLEPFVILLHIHSTLSIYDIHVSYCCGEQISLLKSCSVTKMKSELLF